MGLPSGADVFSSARPPLLYAKGKLELAVGPIVSMVGARNGCTIGQKFTRQLATELGSHAA